MQLKNIKIQEDKNRKFFDFWSKYYDKEFSIYLFDIISNTLNSIKVKDNSRILDIGCGTGNLLYLLEKENKNLELYGIDLSKKMLEKAGKKLNKAKLIEISAIILDKKFHKEFFDYIFVVDAFHHLPNHKELMRKFYKILKKDGMLIITDFDFGIFFNFIFHLIEPGNSGIYTKKQIKSLFIGAGFLLKKQKKIGLFSVVNIGVKK